ncbi:MAG: DUF3800 domain-containing protein [bacterium]
MDSSGIDCGEAPFIVHGGIGIPQHNYWKFITSVWDLENDVFGTRLYKVGKELKGKKLLCNDKYKMSKQFSEKFPSISNEDRRLLVKNCLSKGNAARGNPQSPPVKGVSRAPQKSAERMAYANAGFSFVDRLLDLCLHYNVKAFAAVIEKNMYRDLLKREFMPQEHDFLFQRFYDCVVKTTKNGIGIVFSDDEQEKILQHTFELTEEFFRTTSKGKEWSSRLIPSSLYVKSDFNTAIQVADIIIYCINWGFCIPPRMSLTERKSSVRLYIKELFESKIDRIQYKEVDQHPDSSSWFGIYPLPMLKTERRQRRHHLQD